MRRTVLKSKIHRATVTAAHLDYVGSMTLDADLMDAADILPHEQIHVWDVTTGARIVTYALPGGRGSGVVQVNGAGAHLMKPGDVVIIATFTTLGTKAARKYEPVVVFADAKNRAGAEPAAADPEADGAAAAVVPPKSRRAKRAGPPAE